VRWALVWLGALLVVACAAPRGASPDPTVVAQATYVAEVEGRLATLTAPALATQAAREGTRTAVVAGLANSPAGIQTAITTIFDNPAVFVAPPYIDPRDVAASPSRYVGKPMVLQGRALTVRSQDNTTWFQLMAQPQGSTATESMSVQYLSASTTIRRDDCYKVEAIGAGSDTITLQLTGVKNEVPLLLAMHVEPVTARDGRCPAP
jgi:hypothetical protein